MTLRYASVSLLTILWICLLALGGCGGPDTAPMLAEFRKNAAEAKSAIANNNWGIAANAVSAAYAALGMDLSLIADDKRTLDAHLSGVRSELSAAIRASLPRLGASPDRATLALADQLVASIGDPALVADWKQGLHKEAEARIAAAEASAKAEAARKLAADLASGFVLVLPYDKDNRRSPYGTFADSLTALLSARFAPVPVTRVASPPAAGTRLGGLITLALSWQRVDYGGPTDVLGKGVPVSLTATLTIAPRGAPTSLDGAHPFTVRKDTPQQISVYGMGGLRDEQTKALFGLLTTEMAKLPAISDGAAVAKAIQDAAAAPQAPAWRLVTTWKAKSGSSAIPSYSYANSFAELIEATSRKLGGIPLVPDADPATTGTVTLALEVVEATFGSGGKTGVQTVNGNVPAAMGLTVTIAPASGKARTTTLRTVSTGPDRATKGDLDDLNLRERRRLLAELASAIATSAAIAP